LDGLCNRLWADLQELPADGTYEPVFGIYEPGFGCFGFVVFGFWFGIDE
jgi:hypothetical protein